MVSVISEAQCMLHTYMHYENLWEKKKKMKNYEKKEKKNTNETMFKKGVQCMEKFKKGGMISIF